MQAYVQPTTMKVKSDSLHEGLTDPTLRFDRERSLNGVKRRKCFLTIADTLDEIGESVAQISKQRIDFGLAKSWIITIQEGVIGGKAESLTLRLSDLSAEPEHFGQMGQ
jgi:hypothetical protein